MRTFPLGKETAAKAILGEGREVVAVLIVVHEKGDWVVSMDHSVDNGKSEPWDWENPPKTRIRPSGRRTEAWPYTSEGPLGGRSVNEGTAGLKI
jgi:hypothetical protein